MKRISSKLNRVKIKKSQLQNTANNMNAQDEQSISAEDYQWELMAQEAFERSYYLHLGYNNYQRNFYGHTAKNLLYLGNKATKIVIL